MVENLKKWMGIEIIPILTADSITYKIRVAKQKRNPFFITSPKIREVIATKRHKVGKYIGFINAQFANGTLSIKSFHPIGWGDDLAKENGFLKTSTAALIETRILKDVQTRFPEIKYVLANPSSVREEQLLKRGLFSFDMYHKVPFSRFDQSLRAKLKRDLVTHRRK